MKKFIAIVLFFMFASVLLARDSKLCAPIPPADARLDLYPHADRPLSIAQLTDLGLSSYRLAKPFTGFNFYRNSKECGGGSWRLETIPAGEIVYRGTDGYIAYRASCCNRLAAIPPPVVCPQTKPCPPPPAAPKKYLRSFWQGLVDAIEWPFYGYE